MAELTSIWPSWRLRCDRSRRSPSLAQASTAGHHPSLVVVLWSRRATGGDAGGRTRRRSRWNGERGRNAGGDGGRKRDGGRRGWWKRGGPRAHRTRAERREVACRCDRHRPGGRRPHHRNTRQLGGRRLSCPVACSVGAPVRAGQAGYRLVCRPGVRLQLLDGTGTPKTSVETIALGACRRLVVSAREPGTCRCRGRAPVRRSTMSSR